MSSITVSTTAVASIGSLLDVEMKPTWMKNLLINGIKERMKHKNLSVQKDILNLCISIGVCPPGIVKLAKQTVTSHKLGNASKRQRNEERRIIKLRINDKSKEICDKKLFITNKLITTRKS